MGKNNIIEINGRRYDAVTGKPLSGGISHAVVASQGGEAQPAAKVHAPTKIIQVSGATETPAPKTASATVRVHDAVKARPQNRQQQHSKTLMRKSVTKPGVSLKRHAKAQGHTDALVDKPAARLQPKASVRAVDSRRIAKAHDTPKSQAVSRFSKQPAGPAPQPPLHVPEPTHKPHGEVAQPRPAVARPQRDQASIVGEMVERALRNATSHEQTYDAPKRRRLPHPATSASIVAATLIVLGGFVAYQNLGNIKVHMASSKAGFAANLPAYRPAGYHLSQLNSAPGVVALNFQNKAAGQSYAVTEKASDWDSEALRDSFLASSGQTYQTVQAAGQTLFLYGRNSATWVSGGVWYQVQSSGGLSGNQLVQLAASL